MSKEELFIYYPWDLTWEDYWQIAQAKMKLGQYFPFYLSGYAVNFAQKIYNSLDEREKFEKCFANRLKRLAFVYHKWAYDNPPAWWQKKVLTCGPTLIHSPHEQRQAT